MTFWPRNDAHVPSRQPFRPFANVSRSAPARGCARALVLSPMFLFYLSVILFSSCLLFTGCCPASRRCLAAGKLRWTRTQAALTFTAPPRERPRGSRRPAAAFTRRPSPEVSHILARQASRPTSQAGPGHRRGQRRSRARSGPSREPGDLLPTPRRRPRRRTSGSLRATPPRAKLTTTTPQPEKRAGKSRAIKTGPHMSPLVDPPIQV
jgi:hypothetical protein